LVSPVAGGINGGGRINSLVARIMNKSDEIDHKLAALAKALEVNASDDGAAVLTKALGVKSNITKICLLDNEIGGDEQQQQQQPAIFLVSPVAGGINGGGRINSLVARIMNKSDEIDHKLAALAKALEVNVSDDGAAALSKAFEVKSNITKIHLLDNEIGGDAAAAIANAEAIAKALEAIAVPWTTI